MDLRTAGGDIGARVQPAATPIQNQTSGKAFGPWSHQPLCRRKLHRVCKKANSPPQPVLIVVGNDADLRMPECLYITPREGAGRATERQQRESYVSH